MPVSALLVVLSTLSAPDLTFNHAPAAAVTTVEASPERRAGRMTPPAPRPHRLGFGGSMGVSNRGGGGALRYWFGERVGVDFMAGYFRGGSGSTLRSSSVQAAPSMLVMLTAADPSRGVDLRPYVGAGTTYVRASSSLRTDPTIRSTVSGTGVQAFGGVEMTFHDNPNLAISAELGYYRQNVRLAGLPVVDGVDGRVYVHFYLR